MYLINTSNHSIHEFIGSEIPKYAILSHRWGNPGEEMTFRELLTRSEDRRKPGTQKMLDACRVAREQYHMQYIWIDTCCINKESSAELSEAINSMFQWYKNAALCLAFLNDVDACAEDDEEAAFQNSKWFTRAWTLQELLAPERVIFFDKAWATIGSKHECVDGLEKITGIPRRALLENERLWQYDIVQKMNWAADRQATRIEDIAYSLIGIFEVNMPLLYGEGQKAFVRLQEEIMRSTNNSIFLSWGIWDQTYSLLANTPSAFQSSTGQSKDRIIISTSHQSFAWTNLGLQITAKILRLGVDLYGMQLQSRFINVACVMILRKSTQGDDLYYKVCNITLEWPVLNRVVSRTTLLTILRGTMAQRIKQERRYDSTYLSLLKPYTVEFQNEADLLICPQEGDDQVTLNELMVIWTTVTQFGHYEAKFTNPGVLGIANLIFQMGNYKYLLRVALDFGWRLCLLVVPSDEKGQGSHRSRSSTLQFLDDAAELSPLDFNDFGWLEAKPQQIDDERGRPMYLSRVEGHHDHCVYLPAEPLQQSKPIWLLIRRRSQLVWDIRFSYGPSD